MQELISIVLLMASYFFVAVETNTNLPPQFKSDAKAVAERAIAMTNRTDFCTPSTTSTVQNSQNTNTGGIITPMDLSGIDLVLSYKHPVEVGNPHGAYSFDVYVKGADGKTIKNAEVQWELLKNGEGRPLPSGAFVGKGKTDAGTSNQSDPMWRRGITVVPKETGKHVLRVTSGSLSKEIEFDVN